MVAMAHTNLRWKKSDKLADVLYDIRGPVLAEAQRLEDEGHHILKLNIGNPAPFGFNAPDEIQQDYIRELPHAQGYSTPKASCPPGERSCSTTRNAASAASTSTGCTWATGCPS
jgi:aspartate/methionine/tyrosine aminotransferase